MRQFLLIAFLALLPAAQVAAQRTWIVDAARGPGTDFLDVPPALAVAVHGDTIRVRRGLYTPGTTNQGITILGDDGALFDTGAFAPRPPFRVTGLAAGRTFVMKRMGNSFQNASARLPLLMLDTNAGRIHLERLTFATQGSHLLPVYATVTIERCQAVTVNDCAFTGPPPIRCSSSRLAISSSTLQGESAVQLHEFAFPSHPGLVSSDSTVTVALSALRGGNGLEVTHGFLAGSPAAVLSGGEAILAGDAGSTCLAGISPRGFGVVAVRADGVDLVVDPTVNCVPQGGASVLGGVQRSLRWWRVPALAATGAPPGMAVTTDLYAEPGHIAALLAGPPGDPVALALGRLWLDPAFTLVVDVGYVGAGQHRAVTLPVPPDPVLRGAAVALQSLSGDAPALALALSTPAIVVLE